MAWRSLAATSTSLTITTSRSTSLAPLPRPSPSHPNTTATAPAGSAFDASGNLYVDYSHHSVVKSAPPYDYSAIQTHRFRRIHGVAVDQSSGHVYVNDRTHIALYKARLPGNTPLQVGSPAMPTASLPSPANLRP